MRRVLFAMLLVAAPHGAFALTWDFDDGSTWGWTARESTRYTSKLRSHDPLHSEVVDGVWRIAPVPGRRRPTVQLRSPWIGKDSALFDRLTLRLRLIHHSSTEGEFSMHWSNAEKRRLLASDTKGVFGRTRLQPYPLEWEDITLDLRALAEADRKGAITWQDTLFMFHIDMLLYRDSQDVENHPKFLEIDWIQLTGAEELAQGELSLGDLAVELGPPGTLFAEPDFFPLGKIPGSPGGYWEEAQGVVGDVDGDSDTDLVVLWNRFVDRERQLGWTVASNDGLGSFEPTQEVILSTSTSFYHSPIIHLWGSDFDGDGFLDLAVAESEIVELWYNWGGGFEPTLQLFDVWLVGLADGDGDGDMDLLVQEVDEAQSHVTLWINDGYGFVHSDTFLLDSEEEHVPYLPAGQPLGEAASLLWRRPCGPWLLTRPWAAIQQPPRSFEAEVNPCDLYLHLIADLDGDGTVDLLVPPERTQTTFGIVNHGFALWRMDASGGWTRHSLLDWKVLSSVVTASDLNGDGVLDVTMVARNSIIGPVLAVLLGQRNGAPVLEGYYPLPGESSQVLAADVNGDGNTDLVVLGISPRSSHGGVFVLVNQGTPATAVASETATPTTFALGANYPNPFNPTTTIPLAVPAGVKNVDLTIYNVLGQPMRQVWTGPLPAGEHRLTWDGRDAQGQPVATGVYVYRLQVDDQTRTRKMVKIE